MRLARNLNGEQNVIRHIGLLVFLLLPAALLAQSAQSAVGGEVNVWAGGGMSIFNPDWGCPNISPFCRNDLVGPTVYGDVNVHDKWGVEAEARWLHWHNYASGLYEDNYLAGPHVRLARWHGFLVWAKLGLGGGWIQTPGYPAAGTLKGSYFAYAPGGTVEYRLKHNLSVRADYEYEIWPSFVGPPTYTSTGAVIPNASGLTPNGFTFGVSYRFLGR